MLSVAIIATSKPVILPECLQSAGQVSSDVVIVTNADHEFKNYADQKNYAVNRCANEWVLSLDADEVLSPQLTEELKHLDFKDVAYIIPRKNIIFGKTINHTNWDPNGVLRLFQKSKGQFVGMVHEQWQTSGSIGQVTGPIIHYNYATVEEFITKMNTYTVLEDRAENPGLEFLRRYIWHAGFLDGWHGLFLSYLMAIYHLIVIVKLWEKRKSS